MNNAPALLIKTEQHLELGADRYCTYRRIVIKEKSLEFESQVGGRELPQYD